MAKKTAKPTASSVIEKTSNGTPAFPYTTEPKALRRLLTEIPKRPKPPKMTFDTLKSWNVSKNKNARTTITVLKKIGLLGAAGEPADSYVAFMKTGTGPTVLGGKLRETYKVFFESTHAPQNESDEELRKLFNIHSAGGEDALRLQVQTFKALAEHANFDGAPEGGGSGGGNDTGKGVGGGRGETPDRLPPINVDLHIHLPENKSARDYEAIIQDIARYIYGKNIDRN